MSEKWIDEMDESRRTGSFFIFITGGIMSSLGKGIASASIGTLLQARGYAVRMKKLDPYINVDPGTMSPYKHGEVFVMGDGCEADLDFGHYERFTGLQCTANDSLTTGKIYEKVLAQERRGDYLGSDIQVIPHITNEIKRFIMDGHELVDFTICEIGGTVGDIEGLPYIEAIRQLRIDLGVFRIACIHLTYLPYLKTSEELKTKPTQHSVKLLQSMGVQPDIILCRSEKDINDDIKTKLSMFCNVKKENIVAALDVENIYLVPHKYHLAGLDRQVCDHFGLLDQKLEKLVEENIKEKWVNIEHAICTPSKTVRIAVVGKYTKLKDAYISLSQAINHGAIANEARVEIYFVDAKKSSQNLEDELCNVSGILVPGGFDSSGVEGKITAIKFARENKIPFLGICLGLQLAVIEACRNVAGVKDATSREFSDEGEIVIDFMNSWESDGLAEFRLPSDNKGGTMRLGSYRCKISGDSLAYKIYGATEITERHRHRFEVNIKKYRELFEIAGLKFSGMSMDGLLPEIVERRFHPFFIATQAHPEFQSHPFAPHPLFTSFIKAAINYSTIPLFQCAPQC
ncbi:MAG: CTP synthase [Holosporaceae bacterium]|jgi:CTP synthase|nr:CTP synthase [Holosporaceae bacterium]